MNSSRVVLVVLFLLAAAGGILWATSFGRGGPGPDAPSAMSPDASGKGAVEAATADAPPSATDATPQDAAARVAVATEPDPSSLAALVGRVVDEHDRPVAGAEVATTPQTMLDFDNEDLADLADSDPMAAGRQRMREALAQRAVAVTDADGRFRVTPRGASKQVSLRIAARGFEVLLRNESRPSEVVDLGSLALTRGVVVGGRVVDNQNRPVAHVRVTRTEANASGSPFDFAAVFAGNDDGNEDADAIQQMFGTGSAETDAEGRFELSHLTPGQFALQARHPEHPVARSAALDLRAGGTATDVLIALEVGATIRGKVVDVPADVKGLRVFAREKKAPGSDGTAGMMGALLGAAGDLGDFGMAFGETGDRPAADGSFTLRGLRVGSAYQVWAVQTGRGFGAAKPCTQRLDLPAGSSGIELRFDAGITVTCTVVDAATRAPVEQLWVGDRLRGGGGFADMMSFQMPNQGRSKHYPDGFVAVANLRPKKDQTLTLTVDAIGYARFEREGIALPANGALDLGTIALEPVPSVVVTVVDDKSGRPVAGAKVRLRAVADDDVGAKQGFEAVAERLGAAPTSVGTTDAEGHCTLNAAPELPVELVASSKAHAPCVGAAFTAAAKGATAQTLRLLRGGVVEVTVTDPDGKPQKGVTVEHRQPVADTDDFGGFGGLGGNATDGRGIVRFERLMPGEHGFRVEGRRGGALQVAFAGADGERKEADYTSVAVENEQTAQVSLQMSPTAQLRGVVRENGIALAGARVAFVAGPGGDDDPRAAMMEMAMDNVFSGFGQGGGPRTSGKTDDDGVYELGDLKAGDHRLRITHKDRAMPTVVPVTLRLGDNVFDIDLETAILRGIVRDSQGQPVAKAKVRAQRAPKEGARNRVDFGGVDLGDLAAQFGGGQNRNDGSVVTEADGSFELRGVEPDVDLVVSVRATGLAPGQSATLQVGRAATKAGIAIELGSAGAIKVTLTEAKPFSNVRARCLDDDTAKPVVKMLQGASVTLDGLRPGRWEVTLTVVNFGGGGAAAGEPQKRTVEVAAGATAEVAFQ